MDGGRSLTLSKNKIVSFSTEKPPYPLKHATDTMTGLKHAICLGGDVDSVASVCTGILAGHSLLAIFDHDLSGFTVGVILIAIGAGGIKSSVSANASI